MSTTTIDPRIEERTQKLAAALEEQRLAQLRAEAAAAVAEEDAEAERQREIAQFTAALPEKLSTAAIEKAEQKMVAAIESYVAAVHQRDLAFSEAGYFVAQHDCGRVKPDSLEAVGQRYRGVDVQQGVYNAFAAAMRQYYPRAMFRLDLRH
jgi:multidrug efflux pump subunit AcrA (membrane-fusion protein)